MAAKGARVHIYGDWDGSAVKKASKDLDGFGKEAKGLSSSVKGAFLGVGAAIGAAFSLDAVINFMKGAAQAAMEDERSMVALAKAMENIGLAAQNAGVESFIEDLMLARGVADDELRPAFQQLVTVTGDVAESQKALSLALDISAGTGRDLQSVSQALSRAYSGQTTALQRLGVGIDAATLASKDMDAITAALAAKFEGQSAAAAATYQGQLNRLNVAVGEATESIGYSLLNALDKTAKLFGGPGGFQSAIERATTPLISFTDGIADLADQLAGLGVGSGSKAGQTTKSFSAMSDAVDLAGTSYAFWDIPGEIADIISQTRWLTDTNYRASQKQAVLNTLIADYADYADAAARGVDAQARATGNAATQTSLLVAQIKAYEEATGKKLFQVQAANRYYQDAGARAQRLAEEIEEVSDSTDGLSSSLSSGSQSMSVSLAKLRTEFRGTFGEETRTIIDNISESLTTNLDAAKEKVTSWAQGMTSTIMQGFGLSSSYESALQEDGKVSAAKWIKAVDDQVAQWQWFGNVLNAVRGSGNDPARQALAEYLASEGVDKGGVMGQALIDEGLIDTMAGKMQAVRNQARLVAQNMVPESLTAGVDSAQATYDGWKAAIGKDGPVRKALNNLMDNLAASMKRDVRIDIVTVRTEINEVINRQVPGVAGVRARANGGPLFAGVPTLVGERGPELILPPVAGTVVRGEKTRQMLRQGGGDVYLTVNAGMGTNGPEVGRQIVDALKAYERRNGPVYASA